MSPELVNAIFQVSRYLFPFLLALAALSALGWVHAEKVQRRDRLRSLPEAGKIGELVVLSGSDELPPQTWFPVTREGVLGSVRSCDLVVPCPGVRSRHLDYAWRDGVGLVIYPRSGCEVQVNGTPLNCRSDVLSCPLTHGSCLRVGEAVLRLQVLKALDHTYAASPEAYPQESWMPEQQVYPAPDMPVPYSSPAVIYPVADEAAPYNSSAIPFPAAVQPDVPPAYYPPVMPSGPVNPPPEPAADIPAPLPVNPAPVRPNRRSDRWKEEWGE